MAPCILSIQHSRTRELLHSFSTNDNTYKSKINLKFNLPIKKKVHVGSIIKETILKWYLFSWAVPRARRNSDVS
jgi:hypothetical protein